MAPHPELESIDWSQRPLIERETRRAVETDLVSLQHAWAGVAETGTLLFPADATRPATLNLLPETEIVLLRASAIVGAYEEAWDRLRAERKDPMTGGFMPRNLMLVTGPSRSADIEQTLELGAHGPRRLHILLVEDEAA
jgi:L-lactate dehydrogenase complex protein LldG